ncbi:hypothetical protein [Aquincola sp. J276]|uniref:hypothetical protein n=1 Tax=Aquincola sp. J276 TaxID=2898432 RepID=UPI0021508226|nr:hypothetical protein [Aquincola sp. J276]MCR5867391.1 hypothetical protein [Aquincola sp. J276]
MRRRRALLAGQLAGDEPLPPGDPGTPAELLPRNGAFPTERVAYRQLLIDSTGDAGVQPLEQLGDALSLATVLSGQDQGFTRVASGALLTFSQDWFSQGVALGQLLHSLSLAPGESTRMAMIDWSRQSRGSSSEDIDEAERLANTTTHQRALSEVTEATAAEVQGGSSRTQGSSRSSQGGSALGFEVGPIAFGGSSGGGSTRTEALTVTSSFGRRDLSASVSQQINDVTQQQASAARSRRASIVQEVAQQEHEALSTRVVCNYNHMHALNVQYYEVVQAFRVSTTLQRAERVLFVPLKLVDFGDALTLERWRAVLADVALSDDIRRQLTTEFGVVEIVPNLPRLRIGDVVMASTLLQHRGLQADRAAAAAGAGLRFELGPAQSGATLTALKGFDAGQLGRLASLSARTLLRNGSDAVFVPDEARLHAVAVTGRLAGGLRVVPRAGGELPATSVGPAQITLETPARVADLAAVQVQLGDAGPGPATIKLMLDIGGAALPLDVPVQLNEGGAADVLQFSPARAAPALLQHLRDNALHYSRAIFERLDATTLSGLLSRLTLRGVPLGSLVDPQPVAVVANAVVLKLNLPATGEVGDPALAAEVQAWQEFLQRRGLDRPVPQSQTVPLPTGGVFAEAVLGRFNSAEKIDLTRFFDWQASPIPLTPPEIAALPAASRQRAVDLTTSALGTPLLKQTEPTALPAGANAAAVLAALQAGSPFRDLSATIAANAGLAQSGSELSGAGATAAASQAADTLKTVMAQNTERLKIAADLFTATQAADAAKASPTQAGLAMTTADRQDQAVKNAGSPAQAAQAASGNTLEQQAQAAQTGGAASATVQKAVDGATAGVAGEGQARPTPTPAQRRGGRRVTPAPAAPAPGGSAGGGLGGLAGGILSAFTDVRFSVSVQAAPGAKLPKGERRLRIADATGRTVLSIGSQDNRFEGIRPKAEEPLRYQVSITSDNPAFTLSCERRMIPPGEVAGDGEHLQVRPVLVKREAVLPLTRAEVLLLGADALLAQPELASFADELPRLAVPATARVRGNAIVIEFSVFSPSLANRQILA